MREADVTAKAPQMPVAAFSPRADGEASTIGKSKDNASGGML